MGPRKEHFGAEELGAAWVDTPIFRPYNSVQGEGFYPHCSCEENRAGENKQATQKQERGLLQPSACVATHPSSSLLHVLHGVFSKGSVNRKTSQKGESRVAAGPRGPGNCEQEVSSPPQTAVPSGGDLAGDSSPKRTARVRESHVHGSSGS